MGEELSTDPGSCFFSSFPGVTNPSLPHTTLVLLTSPLLEPRLSGCEQHFVCCSLKRAPGSLEDYCLFLADRILVDFHCQMLCVHFFLALVLCAGEPGMWLRLHTPQENPLQLRYPSKFSASTYGSRASPSHISAVPTSLHVISSVNSWL